MRFRSTLLQSGKTATGVRVPDEVVEALGGSKRPAVVVNIGDYSYRTSIARMGDVFMLPVSAEHRAGAGIAAGDALDITVELDREPRVVEVPADLQAALDQDAEAAKTFESLTYSHKRRLVLAIEAAKAAETRQRRIDKTVAGLREGRS